MKKKFIWTAWSHVTIIMLAAILTSCGASALMTRSNDDSPAGRVDDEVKIAIAWRSDTDNEFCTNVMEAFRQAGVTVKVLPQVKAPYINYEGTSVSTSCLDSEGIGYLAGEYATMIRANTYEGSNASDVLKDVDGVIFTGGEDIASTLYATPEDWHHIEAEIDFNAARDVSDYLTMTYCLDHDIPLLGLCRGSQMLGVVSGATMIQDIPTWFESQGLPYHYEHRREKAEGETYRDYVPHTVNIAAGSLLSGFVSTTARPRSTLVASTRKGLKKGTLALDGCPSWHHQAMLSVEGTPLRCVGTTTVSGIPMIEAVERTDKHCAVGLQFHPEAAIVKRTGKHINNANADEFMTYDEAMHIFKTFISKCKSNLPR